MQPSLPSRETIAAEIRAQMARRRMSQQTVAGAIDRTQGWLSRRLTGEIPFTVEDLAAICGVLGVGVMDVLSATEPVLEVAS